MLTGATNSIKKKCEVYNLWTDDENSGYVGTYAGFFVTPTIAPHDNVSLKIKCTVAEEFLN